MSWTDEPRPQDLRADRETEGTITDHQPDPNWRFLDLASIPPIRPACLDPLVGRGELVFITGAPGSGKTRFLVSIAAGYVVPDLADQVAGGALIARRDPSTPSQKILIIDGESGEEELRRMIGVYLQSAGIDPAHWNCCFIHADPCCLDLRNADRHLEQTRKYLKRFHELGVRLVAVDSTLSVFQPSEINDPQWVTRALVPFRSICRQLGMTTIVLCHPPRKKHGSPAPTHPAGTFGQDAITDAIIHVEAHDSSRPDGIKITVVKRRRSGWIRTNTHIHANFTTGGRYECVGDPRSVLPLEPADDDKGPRLTPQQTKAHEFLLESGEHGATTKEIAGKLGVANDTAGEHLRALENKGLSKLERRGPKSRWRIVAEEDGPT